MSAQLAEAHMAGHLESISSSYGSFLQSIKTTTSCMVTLHAQTAVFCCRNTNMQVDTMILTSLASVTAMTESPSLQGAVV